MQGLKTKSSKISKDPGKLGTRYAVVVVKNLLAFYVIRQLITVLGHEDQKAGQ